MMASLTAVPPADERQSEDAVYGEDSTTSASSISLERDERCLDLALEGENFCKAGQIREGIQKLLQALQFGSSDVTIEAAILSQLGNAYYFLGDYHEALVYHERDLAISRHTNDVRGEAKSSGNVGNTLKSLGSYDAAIKSCERQLAIGDMLKDSRIRSRALYNLGNVYHVEGKLLAKTSNERLGKLSHGASETLRKAVKYYETCLDLLKQLNDAQGQGRVLGNMGNTLFFLGDYAKSLVYHQDRLILAHECNDLSAERRAHNNLGNCYIALGQYQVACEQYLKALMLAEQLEDETVIAQICFCLGNVYTLLDNLPCAASYYERHLAIARSLDDLHGQQRALYSLANTWASLNDQERADRYCSECVSLSQHLGLTIGGTTTAAGAAARLPDFTKSGGSVDASVARGDTNQAAGAAGHQLPQPTGTLIGSTSTYTRTLPPAAGSSSKLTSPVQQQQQVTGGSKRESMQKLQLIRLTPQERKKCKETMEASSSAALAHNNQPLDDGFFALLERVQGSRIDDQRFELPSKNQQQQSTGSASVADTVPTSSSSFRRATVAAAVLDDDLFDKIHRAQARTIDDQRCDLHALARRESVGALGVDPVRGGSHATDKRVTADRAAKRTASFAASGATAHVGVAAPSSSLLSTMRANRVSGPAVAASSAQPPPGVPVRSELSDDFFALLHRVQGSRIDDQRVEFTQSINEEDDADEKRSIVGVSGGSADVAPTLPHDEFFALIDRIQSSRIDDQRCDASILKT